MVGSLEACGRVAAVALLAVGSVVPHGDSAATVAEPAPVADVVTACSVTVGTATTDPALATDAARALAAGYAVTDCMPGADLLAAAEARAALSLPPAPVGGESAVGGAVVGTAGGTAAGPTVTTTQGTATVASTPTTSAVPTTSATSTTTAAETTTPTSTGTTSTGTTGTGTTGTETTGTETTGGSSTPTTGSSTADGGTGDGGSGGSSGGDSGRGSGDGDGDGGGGGTVDDGGTSPGDAAPDGAATAAGRYGWGPATRSEDFDGDLSAWDALDGPGHAGDGSRSPAALDVADGVVTLSGGVVTLSGDAAGTTGGMAWRGGATYGRWEARVKAPVGDPTYHAVLRLSPDADGDPAGAIDVVDIGDGARQKADFVLHDGDSDPLHGQVAIDATRWHNWAVEWAPDHITAYVDGQEWYTTRDTDAFPPGPLHLALQLDWFPEAGDAPQPSTMSVDRVRYYPLAGDGTAAADVAGPTASTTTATTSALTTTSPDTATVTATSTADPDDSDASDG